MISNLSDVESEEIIKLNLCGSKYPYVFVSDVCSVGDGAHSKVNRVSEGLPYLTSKNIGQGKLKLDNYDCISIEDFERLFSQNSKAIRRPMAGDVLIGIIGTFGNAYLYKNNDHFGFASSIGILRPNQKLLLPGFLYYAITSPKFKNVHSNYNAGSVQGYTNIPTIKKLQLPLPPLNDQKKITALLTSLDDRITLLRETNTTLEAIAQTLFKSWFVDFDPVRAKQQGREPEGMDAETAALFPDSFEESELGLVPMGWQVGILGDILVESTKRVGKTSAIVLSAVQSGELVRSSEHFTKKVHSEDISKYKEVSKYAFAYNPSRINIGSIGINEFDSIGAVSPVYVVARPNTRELGYFLWHHLKTSNIQEWIKILCSGTVRQSLSFKDFSSIPILTPPHEILSSFLDIRDSLYVSVNANRERINLLTTLRDILLPRLISGQLRLREDGNQFKESVQ
ncbi:restriction endonuclease subunit S [Methylicorpusculum oleiharenae]|uniref:restriction endonuclease subunit S n=1 Tax=Methylicorpusculum oleiharenae TaxID=1338687 RepID=UPI00135A202E|nr:restriction endonuclease subunit S [Methylicorpusculum oleiharenae]MCD2449847.1 restriction endonuclease subunit S [Methylicorpusculum oleiharenae]